MALTAVTRRPLGDVFAALGDLPHRGSWWFHAMETLGFRVKHVGSLAEFPHLPPGRYVCESPGHLSAFAVGLGFVEWATAATPSLVGRCPGTPGDLPGVVMAKTFNQYAEHAESSIADLLFRVYRITGE